ncbi:MAG: hypothetical protein IM631_19175 [Cytophagales bacterium]|nr:hypothetical protein [Cytophagales bacterium]MCA6373496.1 hypothetical protein [Cytophagales bacterium]MCA6385347.1 hypothetical protein [Cytophagales bacterium]
MDCEKNEKITSKAKNSLSVTEAEALYSAIDIQLLKEASVSESDAADLVKNIAKPLAILPSLSALDLLQAIDNKYFALMLLYSFIPADSQVIKDFPAVAAKRNEHIRLINFIADKTQVEVSYVQKHLRNVLVKGFGKSPENILHDLISNKEELKGLGWVTEAVGVASALVPLFGGRGEDKSDVGYQNFLRSVDTGSVFPSLSEIQQVGTTTRGWDGWQTYNEATGTFTNGDWRGKIISLKPIKATMFKGAREQVQLTSTVNSQALERAYAKQTGPAKPDWSGNTPPAANRNITNDPAFVPAEKSNNTALIVIGSVLGVGVLGYAALTLTSNK